jgi:hypothetical protein
MTLREDFDYRRGRTLTILNRLCDLTREMDTYEGRLLDDADALRVQSISDEMNRLENDLDGLHLSRASLVRLP